jgi:glycosyltransferase involved in cell wall biosynthesis
VKIVHVSTRLILGGSQENTVLSCEGQVRLGHEVHLVFGPIYGPEGSLLSRVQNFRGPPSTAHPNGARIITHELPSLVRPIHPLKDLQCVRDLSRLFTTLQPDIVHTHSSKAGIVGRLAAWRVHHALKASGQGRIGVLHTIHGPPFYRGQNPLIRRLYIESERFAAKRCHMIASVAKSMTDQFLAENIGRPEQYQTVFSGMEVERYLPAEAGGTLPSGTRNSIRRELGFTDADFVIGTVARLSPQKGHDDLLDALLDELPKRPHWKLLWVGDGWLRAKLEQRLASSGLQDRVKIVGLVPSEQVPTFIAAMDILAHASHREGLPRTVPQALLGGVCPVAYDIDGTGEACIDMHTGRLVKFLDKPALRDAIIWCDENPAQRLALAKAGQAICKHRFSAQHMVDELEKLYSKILKPISGQAGKGGQQVLR